MRGSRLVATVALLFAAAGCKKSRPPAEERSADQGPIDPVSVRVSELLAQLRGDDLDERADAIAQIRGLASRHALDTDEGIALLYALPTVPVGTGDEIDAQTAVVAALAEDPRMEYLPVIEETADGLGASARTRAIALIGMIDDPTAARYFLRLLRAYPDESPSLAFAHLQGHPQQSRVLFPELLALSDHPALFFDVLHTALAYCDAGELDPEVLGARAPEIVASYRAAHELVAPRQESSGVGWMFAESYSAARADAGLLLDLMGCMPYDTVAAELDAALELRDPLLLYWAVTSRLGHGKPPPAKVLERIAASDETRVWLHQALRGIERLDLFPARWRTQEAFARSLLAMWLRGEEGRIPDEIEAVEVVSIDTGAPDGPLDYHVLRFRTLPPHEHAERGWLIGVAGPFVRGEAPTTDDHGGTFSGFQPAGERAPAEHVGDPGEIVAAWKDYRSGD